MASFIAASPLSRREALRRILAASAVAASLDLTAFAADDLRRIGDDPDLFKKEIPWPRILTAEERQIFEALADIIIPEDEHGPAASAVGIVDFLDEWLSAPYDQQQKDLAILRPGLATLDQQARTRFQKPLLETTAKQKTALLEDIVTPGMGANQASLKFFRLLRDRVAGGYYSTPIGWKALGYTGNTPTGEFAGPPPEVLSRLGITA